MGTDGEEAEKPEELEQLEQLEETEEPKLCVAAIAGAYGVKGEVRLKTFTEDPLAVAAYGPLETEDGRARFEVRQARPGKDGAIVRLTGVPTREAAEALKGTRLYVDRTVLPEPEDEEDFYHADLIGLEIRLENGEAIGTVRGVFDFGAGDLLEVLPIRGTQTIMVPFTKEIVPSVKLKEGYALLNPPPGLLPEPKPPKPKKSRKAGKTAP